MSLSVRCRVRGVQAVLLHFIFGISIVFVQPAHSGNPQDRPQAPPAAQTAHKNYFGWNPLDLFMSGRLTVGYEHIFRIGGRYFGLLAQYTSPMNSAFTGIVTGHQSPVSLSDEFQFPETVDVYLCLHGRGRSRTMRYFPRIGVSSVLNPGESECCLYLALGPCGRISFRGNFQVSFALTTLKFRLQGNRNYSWLQLPLFDFNVGLEF